MECDRKLQNWASIEERLRNFIADPLRLEAHKTQLEIYPFYNALRSEDWSRLKILTEQWQDREVPGDIRAQIAYCHGLALEGLDQKMDALMAFNRAFVVDAAASEVISREAALGCFRIYNSLPEVAQARKLHGSPDENPNSTGAFLLGEAAALVDLWNTALGRGEKLPEEFQTFAKFKKQ
jgi:hypothetical protein